MNSRGKHEVMILLSPNFFPVYHCFLTVVGIVCDGHCWNSQASENSVEFSKKQLKHGNKVVWGKYCKLIALRAFVLMTHTT